MKLNYAERVGMPENLMNTQWSNVAELGGTYMVTLLPALNGTIQSSSSSTKGVEKKRYSSTAVRFPLLYYRNRLIVSQFSLRACADWVRPCARMHAHAKVYSSSSIVSNTLLSFRESMNPQQVSPEFPSKTLVFEVNSQKLHKINKL